MPVPSFSFWHVVSIVALNNYLGIAHIQKPTLKITKMWLLRFEPPEIPLWISLPTFVSAQFFSFSCLMVSSTRAYLSAFEGVSQGEILRGEKGGRIKTASVVLILHKKMLLPKKKANKKKNTQKKTSTLVLQ